jgi:hypothetical protein
VWRNRLFRPPHGYISGILRSARRRWPPPSRAITRLSVDYQIKP